MDPRSGVLLDVLLARVAFAATGRAINTISVDRMHFNVGL